tara:strand:+ start:48 stop:776 length:729 start_codon:yes stop_codon:yes gene_type:complete
MALLIILPMMIFAVAPARAETGDLDVALGLATMLRSARTVVAVNQTHINDPAVGNKGLSGEAVLKLAIANFAKATGTDPTTVDPQSRYGRLLQAQMQAIVEVMDEAQTLINQPDVGFKGFVPAVFGRLVNEHFRDLVGTEALVKVTAPANLVRNRKSRPDAWEAEIISSLLMAPDWSTGKLYAAEAERGGRPAYRVLVPEYYGKGCLACHGEPKGSIDVTGYPMEGGKEGDLGGVISVTLFR